MDNQKISKAVEESAKLLRDNPHWTYMQVIEKIKEGIRNE